MKKIIAFLLTALMATSMVACGSKQTVDTSLDDVIAPFFSFWILSSSVILPAKLIKHLPSPFKINAGVVVALTDVLEKVIIYVASLDIVMDSRSESVII